MRKINLVEKQCDHPGTCVTCLQRAVRDLLVICRKIAKCDYGEQTDYYIREACDVASRVGAGKEATDDRR